MEKTACFLAPKGYTYGDGWTDEYKANVTAVKETLGLIALQENLERACEELDLVVARWLDFDLRFFRVNISLYMLSVESNKRFKTCNI